MIATIDQLRWLIKNAAMRRPHLTGRLEKAAFLVLLRPIEHVDGDVWQVESEDGLRFYTLRNGECDCSDYLRHGRGHLCKHRIALFLHHALEKADTEKTHAT
ncbi:MAG: SWIM zinc finger family protein [Dehalococcoidia bacterium]